MRFRLSFRQTILLFTGALLVSSLMAVIGITNYRMTKMTNERLLGTELPAILGEIRNEIQGELIKPLMLTKAMANNTFIKDWLARGEPQDELAKITQSLLAIQQAAGEGANAYMVSQRSNQYYVVDGVLKTLDPTAERDQWFYSFLGKTDPYKMNTDMNEATRQPSLFVDHVVLVDGQRVAAMGLGYSLAAMRGLLENYPIGAHGKVYLVDSSGTVQIHPNDEKPRPLGDYVGEQLAHRLQSDAFSYGFHQRDGAELISASLPVPGMGWRLVAEIPTDELYAKVREATLYNSLVGIAAALLALALMAILSGRILRPVRQVSAAMANMAERGGDLTQRLSVDSADEIGELADSFNRFMANLSTIISQVRQTEEQLQQAVVRVSAAIASTSTRSTQQAEKSILAATAIHEMTATVAEIARNAELAAANAAGSRDESTKGMTISQDTVRSMQGLSSDMAKAGVDVDNLAAEIASISTILETIRAVSDQTNLLALNAAIEAARAGEHGRGFAVVADEVRQLARRTAEATSEIDTKIGQLQQGARAAVVSMSNGKAVSEATGQSTERAGAALQAILSLVESTSDLNVQIATATEEQSVVAEEISGNIQSIAELVKDTHADIVQSSQDCEAMKALALELRRSIAQFKT